MAFIRANFSPIGGQSARGKAPCMWSYKSEDNHAAIDQNGYMNDVAALLTIGDLVLATVVTNLGAAAEDIATAGFHMVMDNAAGVVDLSLVTVLVVTDTS